MKLYQQLADLLSGLINQRVYLPGDKIPSIRRLSRQHKVSVATVQRALEELELRGIIDAKARSGFYVRMPIAETDDFSTLVIPSPPKPVKIHELASGIFHQCEGESIDNLGTSYPAPIFYPSKKLQSIAAKLLRNQINSILEVHFSAGNQLLRNTLAKRLNLLDCRLSSEDLIITNGCLEALSICLRAVARPGDTIAVESPGFVGLLQLIESLGFKALEIPCHPVSGISIEALQLAVEQWDIKAVAIVPTFSNPSGSNMPQSNRQQLVELLAENEIPLIEDDLFGDLAFDGIPIKPCKAYDRKGLVLYCSSASKTIASGLRVGWIAPGKFFKEVSYFKTFTNISAPNFGQMVVAEFLSSGQYDRHLRQMTKLLAQNVFKFQRLIEASFPKGTQTSRPQGGCILWVALPKTLDGYQFYTQALQLGIGIIPGQLSSASRKFDRFVRINCACDETIDTEQQLQRLGKLAHQMCE
jgi:DNA-binding transcriptional MocR family regulator